MQYKSLQHFEKVHGKAFVYVLEELEKCLEEKGEENERPDTGTLQ